MAIWSAMQHKWVPVLLNSQPFHSNFARPSFLFTSESWRRSRQVHALGGFASPKPLLDVRSQLHQDSRFLLIEATSKIEKIELPLLSSAEVLARLKSEVLEDKRLQLFRAMYSSIVGGITTDPAAMIIPLDDHMVHRGHGVFDTAIIADGYLYELDAHLDRLCRSAASARIFPPFDRLTLWEILMQTVSASKCREGLLRYWLSAGRGGFSLSSSECVTSTFYAIVLEESHFPPPHGVKVITSSVPIKPPQFATMKSVNYLPNALSKIEAEDNNAQAGIWLDDEGFIAEGPNMNVAFVTSSGELLLPSFDKILSGCTVKRVVALAQKLLLNEQKSDKIGEQNKANNGNHIHHVRMGNITVEEAKSAIEMMLIGSGVAIMPVVEWDGIPVGSGQPGPGTLALRDLLIKDILLGPASQRTRVDYR
ncbi:hypothetical protein O6H91_Y142000 [Diphasiastrum complanatum]|nr:hypothetical protein O6H91_Y439600 [Diphasiastrum complanatum]KAJ7296131.1 hypothetical protein O6H91_Y142000 [Diphasiastrum complanatum]